MGAQCLILRGGARLGGKSNKASYQEGQGDLQVIEPRSSGTLEMGLRGRLISSSD